MAPMNTIHLQKMSCLASLLIAALAINIALGAEPPPLVTEVIQKKADLERLMSRADPARAQKIHDILSDPGQLSDPRVRSRFLSELVPASLNLDGGKPPRQFIREDAVIACLVRGLVDSDVNVRGAAENSIARHTRPTAFSNYVGQLIAAWPSNRAFSLLRIIGAQGSEEGNAFLRRIRPQIQAQRRNQRVDQEW